MFSSVSLGSTQSNTGSSFGKASHCSTSVYRETKENQEVLYLPMGKFQLQVTICLQNDCCKLMISRVLESVNLLFTIVHLLNF